MKHNNILIKLFVFLLLSGIYSNSMAVIYNKVGCGGTLKVSEKGIGRRKRNKEIYMENNSSYSFSKPRGPGSVSFKCEKGSITSGFSCFKGNKDYYIVYNKNGGYWKTGTIDIVSEGKYERKYKPEQSNKSNSSNETSSSSDDDYGSCM